VVAIAKELSRNVTVRGDLF